MISSCASDAILPIRNHSLCTRITARRYSRQNDCCAALFARSFMPLKLPQWWQVDQSGEKPVVLQVCFSSPMPHRIIVITTVCIFYVGATVSAYSRQTRPHYTPPAYVTNKYSKILATIHICVFLVRPTPISCLVNDKYT